MRLSGLDLVLGRRRPGQRPDRLAAARCCGPSCACCCSRPATALGGNHTWSFHDGDLDAGASGLDRAAGGAPLAAPRRRLPRLRAHAGRRLRVHHLAALRRGAARRRWATRCGSAARSTRWRPTAVRLADGDDAARAAPSIDGRGPRPSPHLALGFQKFLGQELRLARAARARRADPDGRHGGAARRLPLRLRAALRGRHAAGRGHLLRRRRRARRRRAARPHRRLRRRARLAGRRRCCARSRACCRSCWPATWRRSGTPPAACRARAWRAGLFHPTTGYSLPDAVRAGRPAWPRLPDLSAPALFARAARARARRSGAASGFFRLLNRMLFLAAPPAARWRVMQRFYGLPEPLIARFYAGRPTLADKARILIGPAARAAGRGAARPRSPAHLHERRHHAMSEPRPQPQP